MLNQFSEHGQEHVLKYLSELDDNQIFTERLEDIDFDIVNYCAGLLKNQHEGHYTPGTMNPTNVIELPESPQQVEEYRKAVSVGEKLIADSKVGALLVAGGQGTRLGFDGPKGTFPVGPITGKTLFQLHTEKILARERQLNAVIPFYIMTSELNYKDTVDFFKLNDFFGKDASTIIFFKQGMLPPLDGNGKMFLESKDRVAMSPDGHGGMLRALFKNKILEDMQKRGLKSIYYFQVDSPLVNVCDPAFVGYHELNNAEMSAKTVYKNDPFEKLGNIGEMNGKTVVIEYTELSDDEKLAVNDKGKLTFGQGSIGMHVFSVDFFQRIHDEKIQLPYHIAHKKIPYLNDSGELVNPESPNGFKFEQFIFDAFPFAKKVMVMETERKNDFSPIKNKTGVDSPETAKQDQLNLYGEWIESAGLPLNRDSDGNVADLVEVSPLYALNKEQFVEKKPSLPDSQKGYLFE